MEAQETRKANILIVLGIALVILAPYVPNFLFEVPLMEALNHGEIRYVQVIPSVRLGGVLLFAWGIAILVKRSVRK